MGLWNSVLQTPALGAHEDDDFISDKSSGFLCVCVCVFTELLSDGSWGELGSACFTPLCLERLGEGRAVIRSRLERILL